MAPPPLVILLLLFLFLLLVGLSHAYDLRRSLDLPQGFHDEHPNDRQRALLRAYREAVEEGKEGNGDRDRGVTRQGGGGGATQINLWLLVAADTCRSSQKPKAIVLPSLNGSCMPSLLLLGVLGFTSCISDSLILIDDASHRCLSHNNSRIALQIICLYSSSPFSLQLLSNYSQIDCQSKRAVSRSQHYI